MRFLTAAVSAALVATAASEALGDKVKDKIRDTPNDIKFGFVKTADKLVVPGRYVGLGDEVVVENFTLSALADGFAETDTATQSSDVTWDLRVDFQARGVATGELRPDSFNLAIALAGGFDASGTVGSLGGIGIISPNGGTVDGVPLFSHMSAEPSVIWLDLDHPILSLGVGDSLTATFRNTSSAGTNNLALHVADMYGGAAKYASFSGQSQWTRVPAPGGCSVMIGVACLTARRRQRMEILARWRE